MVVVSLDLRCRNEWTLDELEARLMHSLPSAGGQAASSNKRSVQVDVKETFRSGPVRFNKEALDCVEATARNVLGSSGASQGKTLMRRMAKWSWT